jgi:hypothetical protein
MSGKGSGSIYCFHAAVSGHVHHVRARGQTRTQKGDRNRITWGQVKLDLDLVDYSIEQVKGYCTVAVGCILASSQSRPPSARASVSRSCGGFANLPCRIRKSNTGFSGEVKALLRACDGAQTHTHTYIYAYAHAHALTVDARGVYLASQRVTLTIVARSLRFPGRFFHFS